MINNGNFNKTASNIGYIFELRSHAPAWDCRQRRSASHIPGDLWNLFQRQSVETIQIIMLPCPHIADKLTLIERKMMKSITTLPKLIRLVLCQGCQTILGLVPAEWQSGSSVKGRPKLSKTWPAHIRSKLYMATIVATAPWDSVSTLTSQWQIQDVSIEAVKHRLTHLWFGIFKITRMLYQPNCPVSCWFLRRHLC